MRFSTLFILPLSILVLTAPMTLEHEITPSLPVKDHGDPHPMLARGVPIKTNRTVSAAELAMKVIPHSTSPHRPSNPPPTRSLLSRALALIQHFTTPHSTKPHHPQPLAPRDSVSVSISNTFNGTNMHSSQNHAKFEIVNNAKDADITVGDSTNHTSDFHTFGDKNMLNSTGSDTGGWNTKNRGTNMTTHEGQKKKREYVGWKGWFNEVLIGGDYGRWQMPWRAPASGSAKELVGGPKRGGPSQSKMVEGNESRGLEGMRTPALKIYAGKTLTYSKVSMPTDLPGPRWSSRITPHLGNLTKANPSSREMEQRKRDKVNVSVVGANHNSNITRSGNNNTIEVYVAGNGDNMVNITVSLEDEISKMEESGNGNLVRVFIGDAKGVDMRNSTLEVIEKES